MRVKVSLRPKVFKSPSNPHPNLVPRALGGTRLQITQASQAYPSLPKLGVRPEIPVENQMFSPIWEERNICSPKNAYVVEFFHPFLVCSANLDIVDIRFVTVLC